MIECVLCRMRGENMRGYHRKGMCKLNAERRHWELMRKSKDGGGLKGQNEKHIHCGAWLLPERYERPRYILDYSCVIHRFQRSVR